MTQSPSGSNLQEAEDFLNAHPEIEAFDIVLHDANGIGRGKIIRRHELAGLYKGGRHLPISILGLDIVGEDVHETGLIWDQGDGDLRAWPIPGTLKALHGTNPPRGELLMSMIVQDMGKEPHTVVIEGDAVTADFMHREDDAARYLRGRGYQAAALPLQGNLQMIVALPDQGRSTADLLSRQGLLEELTSMEDRHCVRWSVPKFDVHSSMDLAELLQDMGVTDAFDKSKADFSPLSDEAAVLAGVMQAARVKVDEDGVEGAAYTEAIVDLKCAEAPGAKPVEMCLDRPFVFVVATSDGIPLFVGTVQSV